MLRTVLTLVLLLGVSEIEGAPIEINTANQVAKLKPHTRYFLDATSQRTLDDVMGLDDKEFKAFSDSSGTMDFGIEPTPVWLRVDIVNTSAEPMPVVFDFEFPFIFLIDMYQVSDGIEVFHDADGASRPLSDREYDSRSLVFPTILPAQKTQQFYFRVNTLSSMTLPAKIYTEEAFFSERRIRNLILYSIFGVSIGFAIYHLMVFFDSGDRVYIAFTVNALSRLVYYYYLSGEGHFITPNNPVWNNFSLPYCGGIAAAAGLWFHAEFLNLRERSRRGFYWIMGYAAFFLIGVNASYFINPYLFYVIGIFQLFLPLILCAATIPWLLQGYTPARIYFFGNIITFSTIFWSSMVLLGILPSAYDFAIWAALGASLSFCVFSFSMSSRIKQLAKSQQEALVQAESAMAKDHAKSEFLAHMSHEIRTPLNGVLGMIQLLSESKLKAQQRQWINVLKTSGQTLLNIVNDILDYSKIEAGKLTIEKIPCRLRSILHETYDVFSCMLDKGDVKLTLEIDPALPEWVITDQQRIRQIVVNLVSNAMKFTEHGSIDINVKKLSDADHYRISVTDTGIGMKKEEVDKLFTSFEQTRTDIHRRYGGTGLGLAISKQLTEIMGGSIHVSSELNRGSTFWIDLPLPRAKPRETEELKHHDTTKKDELESARPLSILVAEDNEVNQVVIQAMLLKLGHDCKIVENGNEAVIEITEHHARYDVILMDCDMPIKNGYQASLEIRAIEKDRGDAALAIVALTAHAVAGYRELSLEHGMDEHLSKPIHLDELSEVLSHINKNEKPRPAASA